MGCATTTQIPNSRRLVEVKTMDEKSYVINQSFTVHVGDPIVSRRKYLYSVFEVSDRVVASMDIHLRIVPKLFGDPLILELKKGTEFPVLGLIEVKAHSFRSVYVGTFPNGIRAAVLVDPTTGVPLETPILAKYSPSSNYTVTPMRVEIEPRNSHFETIESVEIDSSKPFENYDIIFTGHSRGNATFVYREYSPENLAKPAFFQELTYDLSGEKTIRFRHLQMKILELNNSGITLKVISEE